VKKLESAGFSADEGTPKQFESTLDPFLCLAVQGATTLQDALSDEATIKRRKKVESLVHKELRSRIKAELPALTPERLLTEWYKVDALRFSSARIFDEVDFLLAPVAAVPVFQHGVTSVELDGKQCGHEVLFRFASAVNVLGLTAVAFPTGTTAEGLPLGLQVIGPPGSERMLISIAGKLRG
jgi:Asp-tRNA(Asn)/Glu-tRNA(Gln) amidotransferase A subunit family amidase